jgi:hypothetical protein
MSQRTNPVPETLCGACLMARNGNGGGNVTAENAENGDSGNPGSGNSPTTESGESFRESAEP